MMISDYIKSLDMSDGDVIRTDCPKCGGKKTFTVTNDGGKVLYNCYKLGCDIKGAVSYAMTAEEIWRRLRPEERKQAEAKAFVYPEYFVRPCTEHVQVQKFLDRWDLHDEGVWYDVKDKRVVFPIRKAGVVIDAVGRALDGRLPKWYRYTGSSDMYERTFNTTDSIVVLVEDVISAITVAKVCPIATGLAIMGTSLSTAHTERIRDFDKVIIALDPDASAKTLEYKREVEAWTGIKTIAMKLDDDIKYKLDSDMDRLEELCYD